MFSSFFTTVDPTAPTFRPVTSAFEAKDHFAPLEPKDLEWTIGSGFVTETQVWYHTLEDGTFLILQIIHSSAGMFYPTVQFACKIWDPKSQEKTWKSVNVSNFVTPPPSTGSKTYDKRSSKSDSFTVAHNAAPSDSTFAESYMITANLDKDLQISVEVSRPAAISGFKLGKGPKGGFSYFGHNPDSPDGYVVHRFWPRTHISGHIINKGQAIEAKGTGMFIHAIQGMRPDLVAASWNFCDFQSEENGGTSAVQMEFKTIDAYGRKGAGSGGVIVNIGSIVVGGKLVAVTGETRWPDEAASDDGPIVSRAEHIDPEADADTGYLKPSKIKYVWKGASVVDDAAGIVSAESIVEVGTPAAPKGLVEKVDVLAEIPTILKAFVNYVAGTKPYIYQWFNPATLTITAPASLVGGEGTEAKTITVSGVTFNEATFIS
ncbi:survival factor 1 [Clavulina sp. PMI_390]|nr:survival factor 1 [Clavulina sp. PMI_390]